MSEELMRVLGRLEGKVDGIETRVVEGFDGVRSAVKVHDDRIASLEHSRTHMRGVLGAVAALGSMVGAGVTLLAKKIGIA